MNYIALLRGINVGGHKLLSMKALAQLAEDLGFTHVKTLLQTGNLIFTTPQHHTHHDIIKQLTTAISTQFNHDVTVLLRNKTEWDHLIHSNPFHDEASLHPQHLLVMCLVEAPSPTALEKLKTSITGPEQVAYKNKCLYLVYPNGIGRSALTHQLIEKTLNVSGSARNWNTVIKIQDLLTKEYP